jgi:hypothetical protein
MPPFWQKKKKSSANHTALFDIKDDTKQDVGFYL